MRHRASEREIEQNKKRVASNGHRLPDPIRIGEILTDVAKKQWKIGRSIGVGGFGEIYLACDNVHKPVGSDTNYVIKVEPHHNGPLFLEMNFYIRAAKSEMIAEWRHHTKKKKKKLGMPRYIGSGSHTYKGMKYRFLVLDRFGEDLNKLFLRHGRRFHIKTALTLAVQILDILEYIHSRGFIHADIKGSNLLLGRGSDRNQVYLLDYGLVGRYRHGDGNHNPYCTDERKAHRGTIEFTSRDAHIGACSRRGDLEILGYNLLQWTCGTLPWEKHVDSETLVHERKKVFMANIPELLRTCFPKSQPPAVLGQFIKYVEGLAFEAKPDYAFCRKLLRQGIKDAGYVDDGVLAFEDLDSIPRVKVKKLCKQGVKRRATEDPENVSPVKRYIPFCATPRQPCVVQNTNRITRNSAPSPVWDVFHDAFNWEEVLSSDPEKCLKRRNPRQSPPSPPKVEAVLSPPAHPSIQTSAMRDVLSRVWVGIAADANSLAKKAKMESRSPSPVFVHHGLSYTPAMLHVKRQHEELRRQNLPQTCDKPDTALLLRSGKLRLNRTTTMHAKCKRNILRQKDIVITQTTLRRSKRH